MSVLEIVLLAVLCLATLVVIVIFAIKAIKNGLVKKLMEVIPQAMKEAEEKFTDGKEKKKYVLEKVREVCKEQGIPYDFIATLVSKTIEAIIKGYNSMVK